MYFTVQSTTYVYQHIDEIPITSGLHVSAVNICILPSKTQHMYINTLTKYQLHQGYMFRQWIYVFYRPKHNICISTHWRNTNYIRATCFGRKYMYFTVQSTTYVYQHIDEISITSWLHVSAVKQPSSGQCRTYTRYNISVHFMGSHIVYRKG